MMPLQLLSRSWRGYPVRPPDSGIARRKSIWERIHIDPWLLGLLLALMAGAAVVFFVTRSLLRDSRGSAIRPATSASASPWPAP